MDVLNPEMVLKILQKQVVEFTQLVQLVMQRDAEQLTEVQEETK